MGTSVYLAIGLIFFINQADVAKLESNITSSTTSVMLNNVVFVEASTGEAYYDWLLEDSEERNRKIRFSPASRKAEEKNEILDANLLTVILIHLADPRSRSDAITIFTLVIQNLAKLNKKTGVINDPLGLIHSPSLAVANIVFCCFILLDLKSGDGQMDNIYENNVPYLP